MDVDALKCDSNSNKSSLPDCLVIKETISKTPHHGAAAHLPLATPSPADNDDMAPRPKEDSALLRTVSLSVTEQSVDSDKSESLVTTAPEKKNSDVTEEEEMKESGSSGKSESTATSVPEKDDSDATEDEEMEDSDSDKSESTATSIPEKDDSDVTEDEDMDEDFTTVRRSKREKKSTLVYIDGQAVLAKNNYQMKGLSYQYGTDFETAPPKAAKTKIAANKPKTRKPRTVTQQETKRLEHNAAVKKRIESKKERRTQFLESNLMTMEPFLEKRVIRQLKKTQVDDKTTSTDSQELYLQPDAIQGDMRDYQLAGLNWMVKMYESNLSMILGDEMGLGKTLQTISLLCHLKEREGVSGPSLVICPLSVLYSWCSELERWAPSLKFLRFHSSSPEERDAQRQAFQERATEFDVVITTYEMAKTPGLRSLWSRQYFNLLVLDEGHRIKDATNQISQAVRLIHCENALILTGTPLQNNLIELWSLLNFLYPDVFVTNERFAEAFDLTENVVNKEKLLQAHKLLGLFMIRRLKAEVEKLMPKKVETKVICPLSNTQIYWYKALLMKDINLLARANGDETKTSSTTAKCLSNLVMQLRKCCLHPFLFDGAEVDIERTTCDELIAASGKLAVLDMLLRSLYEKKHRVVLFSQFTSVLDILDDYCTMRGFKHCRFDGSTPRAKRNFIVNQFNAEGSDFFVFLMSTRSGGMGLNLQTADTCILFDSDWNPQPDIQAAARVHRIGQKKTVHVYRLVCGGTIEGRMVERAQKKLYLDQMVNQDSLAGIEDEELGGVSKGELLATLKFGCDAVFGEDNEKQNMLPTAQDIEVITDRSRSETFSDGKLKGGVTDTAAEFKAEAEFTSSTKLGGIDFKEIRDKHKQEKNKDGPKDLGGIAALWVKLQKRNRKSRIVNVAGAGSGYGAASVPVLAANNYDLENGESSVFQRELGGRGGNFGEVKKNVKRSGVDFESADHCIVCGDGGEVICCPRCPNVVHSECIGLDDPKNFLSCPHHRCSKCDKNIQGAGGLLFPCQACPNAFCEDCLPKEEKGFRILDSCDRFAQLGFHSNNFCYIHCSGKCEEYAKKEFGWSEKSKERPPAPAAIDLSHAFGSQIDATIDEAEDEDICDSRLRKRKAVNYKNMDNTDHSMTQAPPPKSAPKRDDDPDFVANANSSSSSDTDGSEFAEKPKKRDAARQVTVPADRPPAGCYDVVFPATEHGYLFQIEYRAGAAVFAGYTSTPDGRKGPAEVANRVRGPGDRIVAVNRVDVTTYTGKQILDLLRSTAAAKCHVVVSFREVYRPPTAPRPVTFNPKYSAAKIRERTSFDGSVAPASRPKKNRRGLYVRPAGRGRSGMKWDEVKGIWVPASNSFTSGRRASYPPDAASNKENSSMKATVVVKNVATETDSKSAALKRKVEDVVDLTSSDNERPTKNAPKPKQPPPASSVLPPLADGQYEASCPVTKYGLLLQVGALDDRTLIYGYRRAPDGSKGQPELRNLIRGTGDRIIAVGQTDVSNLSYKEIVNLITTHQQLNASHVVLRLQESGGGTPLPPSAERPAEDNTVAPVATNEAIQVPISPSEPPEGHYDAAIPMTSRGLMIRIGDLEGSAVFLEYRRFPDDSKGPAEKKNLVRNQGDEIVAVNGVQVTSYFHAIALIQKSRNNPATHLRFRENHEVDLLDD